MPTYVRFGSPDQIFTTDPLEEAKGLLRAFRSSSELRVESEGSVRTRRLAVRTAYFSRLVLRDGQGFLAAAVGEEKCRGLLEYLHSLEDPGEILEALRLRDTEVQIPECRGEKILEFRGGGRVETFGEAYADLGPRQLVEYFLPAFMAFYGVRSLYGSERIVLKLLESDVLGEYPYLRQGRLSVLYSDVSFGEETVIRVYRPDPSRLEQVLREYL